MNSKQIILSTSILTFLWFCGLTLLIQSSSHCVEEGTFREMWVSCRTSNEIGDFLAGSFAPLAFLWLVATVLIQSSALSKQSEELELAREEQGLIREEMRLTREAVEGQLTEAKRNVALIEQQIAIQDTDSQINQKRLITEEYERMANSALEFFYDKLNGKRLFVSAGQAFDLKIDDIGGSVTNRLRAVCLAVNPALSSAIKANAQLTQPDSWEAFLKKIDQILSKLDSSSDDFSEAAGSTSLTALQRNIADAIK